MTKAELEEKVVELETALEQAEEARVKAVSEANALRNQPKASVPMSDKVKECAKKCRLAEMRALICPILKLR